MILPVRTPTAMKDPSNYWTPEDVNTILGYCKGKDRQHYILFKLLWLSGRRISEVIGTEAVHARNNELAGHSERNLKGLIPSDILWDKSAVVWGIEKKARPVREVRYLPESFMLELRDYIAEVGVKGDGRVFTTYHRKANRLIRTVCNKVGVKTGKGCSVHRFRHSLATYIGEKSVPTAGYILAHSDLRVTSAYAHPAKEMGVVYEGII